MPHHEHKRLEEEVADIMWSAAATLDREQYAVLDLSLRRHLSSRDLADAFGISAKRACAFLAQAERALSNAVRGLLAGRIAQSCTRCLELVRLLNNPSDAIGCLPVLPLPTSIRELTSRS